MGATGITVAGGGARRRPAGRGDVVLERAAAAGSVAARATARPAANAGDRVVDGLSRFAAPRATVD